MLLAALLLTVKLSFLNYWGDEMSTISYIEKGLPYILKNVIVYPPLYLVMVYFWSHLFGTGEVSLRFISLLPSIFSIYLVYKLGRYVGGKKIGLLSAFLLTISPFFILFSRMARYYPLAMFLTLFSLYFFVRILSQNKTRDYVGYILSSTLLVYTSYLGISVLISENVFLILRMRQYRHLWKNWILAQLVIVTLFLPYLIRLPLRASQFAGYPAAELSRSLKGYIVKIAYTAYAFSLGETVSPLNFWIVGPAIFFYLVTLFTRMRFFWRNRDRFTLIFVSLIVPLVFTIALTSTVATFEVASHVPALLMFIFPLYCLLVAVGILSFKKKGTQVLLITLVLLISAYSLKNYFTKEQFNNPHLIISWKQIVNDIQRNFEIGDFIITSDPTFEYYYAGDFPSVDNLKKVREKIIENLDCRRFWLVFRDRGQRNIVVMNNQIMEEAKQSGFQSVSVKRYVRVDPRDVFLKEKLLGRKVDPYNVTVFLYARNS